MCLIKTYQGGVDVVQAPSLLFSFPLLHCCLFDYLSACTTQCAYVAGDYMLYSLSHFCDLGFILLLLIWNLFGKCSIYMAGCGLEGCKTCDVIEISL